MKQWRALQLCVRVTIAAVPSDLVLSVARVPDLAAKVVVPSCEVGHCNGFAEAVLPRKRPRRPLCPRRAAVCTAAVFRRAKILAAAALLEQQKDVPVQPCAWFCGASNAQPPQRCQRSPGTGIKSGQRMETKARRRVRLRQRDQNDNQSRSQGACASVCVRACARTTLHVGARAHVLVCRETAQNDTHTHTHTHTGGNSLCVKGGCVRGLRAHLRSWVGQHQCT